MASETVATSPPPAGLVTRLLTAYARLVTRLRPARVLAVFHGHPRRQPLGHQQA